MEEIADKRFRPALVSRCSHERVLESPATRPKSNARSPRLIRSRSIAPTRSPSPKRKLPGVASPCSHTCRSCHIRGQPRQRSSIQLNSSAFSFPIRPHSNSVVNDRFEVVAVDSEIDVVAVSGSVVLSREEVGKSFEASEKVGIVTTMRCLPNGQGQFLSSVMFHGKHAVDIWIDSQRGGLHDAEIRQDHNRAAYGDCRIPVEQLSRPGPDPT